MDSPRMRETSSTELLAPADSYVSWRLQDAVKLRTSADNSVPVLVPTLLANTARNYPDRHALAQWENDQWTYLTYREYYQLVKQVGKGFMKIGLEPRNCVAIIGYNSTKWLVSYLGAVLVDCVPCGIFHNFSADAVEYIGALCSVNVAVVDDDEQLEKILSVRQKLPSLRAIVHCNRKESSNDLGVYSWTDFLRLGSEVSDEELESRMKVLRANTCCTLILTSGTTGKPKAVMLSHDNLTWPLMKPMVDAAKAARTGARPAAQMNPVGAILSFRPLTHISSQLFNIIIPILWASTVYFANPEHLKNGLPIEILRQVRPTIIFGSPEFWNKIEQKIRLELEKLNGVQSLAVALARNIGAAGFARLQRGENLPYGWTVANIILFRRVREELGLDRCSACSSGGAPISTDVVEFLATFGLHVTEAYGMSEVPGTGVTNLSIPGHLMWRCGSVGKPLPGFVLTLEGKNESGVGEICIDGRNVFMGYLNNQEQTKQAFDESWRFRTGDVGSIDGDGFIYITGRIKEMIITSDGMNIYPQPLESAFKLLLPVISNCVIVGDRQDFLAILLCLRSELDSTSLEPTDAMAAETKQWCRQLGSKATTMSDVTGNKDELVNRAIQTALDNFNKGVDLPEKRLRRFYILPKDFSVSGGELGGPLCKMMRSAINEKYKDIIHQIFSTSY